MRKINVQFSALDENIFEKALVRKQILKLNLIYLMKERKTPYTEYYEGFEEGHESKRKSGTGKSPTSQ